jgi:outer membrane receptor for Fe3+-dicitrate
MPLCWGDRYVRQRADQWPNAGSVGRVAAAVRPEIHINNVFDNWYLLKGAFFSGASVGRPRSVQVQVNVAY